jgi:soluble lytic murein transglycosylase-like protein
MKIRCKAALSRAVLGLLTGIASAPGHAVEVASEGLAPECRAIGSDPQRLATKFSLGLAACVGLDTSPVRTTAPDPRRAQQLYLYDAAAPVGAAPHPAYTASRVLPTGARLSAPVQRALLLVPAVDAAARAQDIDPLLLHAIARVESRHDTTAVSPAGALGVMQLMPATASRFGVSPARALHDASANVAAGAAYLKTLQLRFGNDLVLVLAAYNAGEGAVERHGRRVPPYAETRGYVRDVLAEYTLLRRAATATGAKGALL